MNKLITYLKEQYGVTVTKEEILEQLKPDEKPIDPFRVIEAVYNFYDGDIKNIISKSRVPEIMLPNQVAVYFVKEYTQIKAYEIGKYFWHNEGFVYHCIKSIRNRIDTDSDFKKEIDLLNTYLRIKLS